MQMFMLESELSKKVWQKSQRNDFLLHTNFLKATILSLFYCCEKVFLLINIWMSGISDLNMEDITDTDQAQTRRVFKDSEIKTLVKYHDFYVQTCVLQCRNLIALVFLLHHNEHGKQFLKRPR